MLGISLDKKDKILLYELSLNGRISITELAKRLRLSKQVVSYRLSQLEKNKVILGYYAITNIYLLGKTHYRIFVKYQNMSSETEERFMNYLMAHQKVVWIAYFDGDMDAAFLVWAENVHEFEEVLDGINQRFGIYFLEKHFSIATRLEYLKYKFLVDRFEPGSLLFGERSTNYNLDKLDCFILNVLNQNGRASLVELAAQSGTSPKVIKQRIDKLLKNGIIIGFNIKINHNLLGYTHRKVLLKLNNTSKERINALSSYLRNQKSVIYLVKPLGNYDFEFELMTQSNEEFHQIIKDLRSEFAGDIKSYNTVIHYKEPKSGQFYGF